MKPRSTYFVCMIAIIAAAVMTAGPVTAAAICPASPFRSAKTQVIAHASGTYFGPGNSVVMMRRAVNAGADILDADVRVTKDGILVAAHDDDPLGSGVSIAQSPFHQLQTLDLRTVWKQRGVAITEPVRIPSIEQLLRTFPSKRFGLEFKVTGGEQAMCTLLRSLKRTATVFVSSAGDAAVDRFAPLCPEVQTTVTDAMVVEFQRVQNTGEKWCAPVKIGQPPLRQGNFQLDQQGVDWEHEHGLAVYTWTADSTETLRTAIALGVDAVYTERPDLAKRLLTRPYLRVPLASMK